MYESIKRLGIFEVIAGFNIYGRTGYPADDLRLKLAHYAGAVSALAGLSDTLELQERDSSSVWTRVQIRLHRQERELMYLGLESYCRTIKAKVKIDRLNKIQV